MTHAERLRHSLTASRRRGLPFDAAWAKAMGEYPVPIEGWPIEFAMRAFREGYYGRTVLGAASIIGEDYDSSDLVGVECGRRVA